MPVHFTILGSGSGGNCAYCETDQTRLLIDAGFSLRQIRHRLSTIGRTPENLDGILITHEHGDHVAGLRVMCDKLKIPIYCNRLTKEAVQFQTGAVMDCRVFETGSTFEIGDVVVETFSVPHDAQDPVGFMLQTPSANIGFLTDLGHATKLVIERVRASHCLVLEANHDMKMLQDCPHRPWALKQRILGRHGHLSNTAAADAAEQVITAELRNLYLGHLSGQCNTPDLARQIVGERLTAISASHVTLHVASQAAPAPTLTF